jgi:type IV secretion system protein VirB10
MSAPAEDEGAPLADEPRPLSEMRLRGPRPPVTRLSRKVLLSLGIAAAVGIGGALLIALKPQHHVAKAELYNTDNRSPPEGLARLPRDYAGLPPGVPRLGPPLPGDLGRPILAAGAPAPAMGDGSGSTTNTGAPGAQADPEQQRIVQEHDAARVSHLFADASAPKAENGTAPATQATPEISGATAPQGGARTLPLAGTPGTDQKAAFLNAAGDRRTASPDRLEAPESPYVLQAGAVIPAALITGLRSDLPGQVTAQVTQDVYDSPTGRVLMIPQGARLVGQYDAQVSFGQSRALLVWTRLIMPNGRSIVLERQPGADVAGYAGLSDRGNNHWGTLFEAAVLSTILSVGAEAGTSQNENSLVQALRQGASQGVNQVGQQVVGRALNVQPTITIRPGYPVRVMVTRDLVLEPYAG